MTNKELKRLSRKSLLEMLIAEMEQNEALRKELEQAKAELSDRRIVFERAGSLAEAALQLNGVFEAADNAVRQYVENIRRTLEQERDTE